MDNSPLGRLPGEIRNKIYRYALREERGEVYLAQPYLNAPFLKRGLPEGKSPHNGLPSTCKEIRQESRAIYFAINVIRVSMYGSISDSAVVSALGSDMMRHIKQFGIRSPQLKMDLYPSGFMKERVVGKDFFRTLRTISASLDRTSIINCNIVFRPNKEEDDENLIFLYEDLNNGKMALQSIREALRPARERFNIDERRKAFTRSIASLKRKLRA